MASHLQCLLRSIFDSRFTSLFRFLCGNDCIEDAGGSVVFMCSTLCVLTALSIVVSTLVLSSLCCVRLLDVRGRREGMIMSSKLSKREQFVRRMESKARQEREEQEARRQEASDAFQASWLEMNERIGECWKAARRLIEDYGYDSAALSGEVSGFIGGADMPRRMAALLTATRNPSVSVDYSSLLDDAESAETDGAEAVPVPAVLSDPDSSVGY